jgi:hypothetical protein
VPDVFETAVDISILQKAAFQASLNACAAVSRTVRSVELALSFSEVRAEWKGAMICDCLLISVSVFCLITVSLCLFS